MFLKQLILRGKARIHLSKYFRVDNEDMIVKSRLETEFANPSIKFPNEATAAYINEVDFYIPKQQCNTYQLR